MTLSRGNTKPYKEVNPFSDIGDNDYYKTDVLRH